MAIFKDDFGHSVTLTATENGSAVDDTAAATREIEIRKPDGTASDNAAGGIAGTGIFTLTIATGVFNLAGEYLFRCKFSDASGFSYKSSWLAVHVME